jgi:hypothetical protein
MSSSIDSKGIVQILFGNNSITTLQSISELYHNSDDSNASCVNIYCQKLEKTKTTDEEEWFVFDDNGTGMSMTDIENYLKLLNTNTKIEKTQHGKYSFGGKQAVLQLAGITADNKSDLAIVVSKQESEIAVCCEFGINDLLKYGWANTIKPCSLNEKNNLATGFNEFVSRLAPHFTNTKTHGTMIFIKMNHNLKTLFDDNCKDIRYNTSINFFKCLDKCKLYIGKSKSTVEEVKMFDPLYFDQISDKYKKIVTVQCYSKDSVQCFVVDGKYFPIINKLGHIKSDDSTFDSDGFVKTFKFKIYFSMLYELHRKNILNLDKLKRKIYLSRNNAIIGVYNPLNSGQRVQKDRHASRYCNIRIEIESTNNLNNVIDKIFGINMNKGALIYDSMPKNLQKTIKQIYTNFCTNSIKQMIIDYPYNNTEQKEQQTPIKIDKSIPIKIEPKTNLQLPKKNIQVNTDVKPPVVVPLSPQVKTPIVVVPITEKSVQEKLLKRENGRQEVNINGRFIDVLTKKHIIEVKRFIDRLDALKVLYYHMHYPDHIARIHLFDHNGNKCPKDDTFENLCKKNNIKLTYEEI